MSDPIRYEFIYNENFCSVEREEHPEGDYVSYEDYARLKAEVDELKSQPDPLTAYLYAAELAKQEMKCLKAEVERLTKAGDAMASIIQNTYALYCGNIIADWNAAKEGKQP